MASGHTAFSRQEGAAQARVLLVLAFLIGGWQGGLFSHLELTKWCDLPCPCPCPSTRRKRWTWQGGHEPVIHVKENKINWTKSVVSFYKVANRNPSPTSNVIAWVTWSPKLFSYCPRMNSNKKSLLLPFLRWKKTTHQCTAVLLIKTFAFTPFEFTSNLLFFKIESNQLRTKIKKKKTTITLSAL